MLKSLEISGFKSFAKKAILDFSSPITSIVGPNGSGKSNVAESFRFVLGEQSIKSMRGKRGEDLIFNGSNKVVKMNRAAVKVVFDNTRRMLNLDFDEVVIERAVHRDGVNEYFLNGTQVRLKDIVELLASAHVGATGHHIISQGEADRILNANIKERREMIEDALGLKIYQYKRAESEKKLEKTQENIKQVESLRRELAPHLKFLKKQVERVEKAREMKDQLRGLYREYFKREDVYLKAQREQLSAEKRAPLAEVKQLDGELEKARAILDSSKRESGRSGELLSIEQKLKTERAEKDMLHRDIGRIEGELSGVERSLKRIEQATHIEETKTVYLRDVQSLSKAVEQLVHEAEHTDDMGRVRNFLAGIRESFAHFMQTFRVAIDDSQKVEYLKEQENLTQEKTLIETKISHVSNRETVLQEEYVRLKTDIEKEKEGGLEAEKSILKIMARQNEVNGILARLRAVEERVDIEMNDFKRDLGEAGMLVGREAVAYEMADIGDVHTGEDRSAQVERRRSIERIKIRLEEFGGAGGEDVLKEFRESEERDTFLAREVEDLEKSAESLSHLIKDLEERLNSEFRTGIAKINEKFTEFFALMFGGGNASLQLVKEEKKRRRSVLDQDDEEMSEDDLTSPSPEDEEEAKEGIDINVALPHKKVKGLVMLSGGERALTSIALLFAMSQVNPPPFIILDETDAALDEANSRKYGDMIENLSKYSQLILITHNRETMSRAGMLYGVTMGSDGISKLLSISFDQGSEFAK